MFSIIGFAAFLAFCLSPYRRPILGPDPAPGPGDPDPIRKTFSDPMPGITGRIFGMLGGIAAGVAVHFLFPNEGLTTVGLAAFAGGVITYDIAGRTRAVGK